MKLSQKRILSILAAAAMTCGALPQSAPLPLLQPVLTASAEDAVYEDFTYTENEDGSITITKYKGTDAEVVIPGEIDGKSVTVIGKEAFYKNTAVTSVLIPENVHTIGATAFEFCEGLTEIILPGNLRTIENCAFAYCSALTRVVMTGDVTSIGPQAFADCTNLADINIPESVTEIGFSAFSGTAWLAAKQEQDPLVIVNHILIDGTACKGEVSVPRGVTSIGGSAFNGCKDLTRIYIPYGVESIGDNAFYNCIGLTNIDFESAASNERALKAIGSRAFYNCQKLSIIYIPDTVTDIGFSTFYSCKSLRSVRLPKKLTRINRGGNGGPGVFQECSLLEYIEIPEGVTNIGMQAFAQCSSLSVVKIYGINTTIEAAAFFGCASGLTLFGYAGSSAQTYADNYNINFAELDAQFSGVSLTLTDDLGLNFFVKGMSAETSEDYYVVFDGECEEAGQEIKFTDKDGKFCATANVAAPNMDRYIVAELYRFNGERRVKVDETWYTVNRYLSEANPEEGWSEEKTEAFRKLVDTVKLYGEVSHAYFNDPEHMPEVTDHSDDLLYGYGDWHFDGYAKYDTATQEDYYDTKEKDKLSLTLNSRLSMRLYLDGLAEGNEAQLRNINNSSSFTPLTAKTSRFGSYFEITDISPLKLNTPREIHYNGFAYQFSPLTWCYRVMAKGVGAIDGVMANILFEYYIDATAFNEAN